MVTVDQIYDYFEKLIAEGRLSGNQYSMKQIQTTAGLIMSAAQASGDKETARRFQILAAHAANKHEELTGEQ